MNAFKEQIRVKLELFEGPLDLLLHLIRTQHIEITAIPIAQITEQYLETLEMMKELDLDIAGEYIVMAATLMLIKSRILLPPAPGETEEESAEELKEQLIRRLQEYETYKFAGTHLETLEKQRSSYYQREIRDEEAETHTEWIIEASLTQLMKALGDILNRNTDIPVHMVKPNPVSVRKKMAELLEKLNDGPVLFSELFLNCRQRRDIIGTFLALLELMRIQAIKARQRSIFGEIRLAVAGESREDVQ